MCVYLPFVDHTLVLFGHQAVSSSQEKAWQFRRKKQDCGGFLAEMFRLCPKLTFPIRSWTRSDKRREESGEGGWKEGNYD